MFSSPTLIPDCSRPKRYARALRPSRRSMADWDGFGDRYAFGQRRGFGARYRERGPRRRHGRRCAHEPERVGDCRFHLAAIDDEIDHAFFEEELAALEPLGQRLADGLFDDT